MSMLTTLVAVKDELNIPQSTTRFDNRVNRIVEGASALIEGYCSRTFGKEQIQAELYQGKGHARLYLRKWPILSVVQVIVSTTPYAEGVDFTTFGSEKDGGYLWRQYGWPWRPGLIGDLTSDIDVFSADFNISVTYLAGYDLPTLDQNGNEVRGNLPGGVYFAATRQAAYMFAHVPNIRREKTPGNFEAEFWQAPDVMDEVKPMLAPFVRWL